MIVAVKYKIKGIIDSTLPPDFPIQHYDIFALPEPSLSANYGSLVYVFRKGSIVDVTV
jgi:L-ascorbate oxidase